VDFNDGFQQHYVRDEVNGQFYAKKLCFGCMERYLCLKYGTDLVEIKKKLAVWRKKQKGDAFLVIGTYRQCSASISPELFLLPVVTADGPAALSKTYCRASSAHSMRIKGCNIHLNPARTASF
jgi:hypothetical protein